MCFVMITIRYRFIIREGVDRCPRYVLLRKAHQRSAIYGENVTRQGVRKEKPDSRYPLTNEKWSPLHGVQVYGLSILSDENRAYRTERC